jgi:hypothetical protein
MPVIGLGNRQTHNSFLRSATNDLCVRVPWNKPQPFWLHRTFISSLDILFLTRYRYLATYVSKMNVCSTETWSCFLVWQAMCQLISAAWRSCSIFPCSSMWKEWKIYSYFLTDIERYLSISCVKSHQIYRNGYLHRVSETEQPDFQRYRNSKQCQMFVLRCRGGMITVMLLNCEAQQV